MGALAPPGSARASDKLEGDSEASRSLSPLGHQPHERTLPSLLAREPAIHVKCCARDVRALFARKEIHRLRALLRGAHATQAHVASQFFAQRLQRLHARTWMNALGVLSYRMGPNNTACSADYACSGCKCGRNIAPAEQRRLSACVPRVACGLMKGHYGYSVVSGVLADGATAATHRSKPDIAQRPMRSDDGGGPYAPHRSSLRVPRCRPA